MNHADGDKEEKEIRYLNLKNILEVINERSKLFVPPNQVIERKLVQVLTPSILIHGNIGPHAVYLLSLKEGTSGLADGSTAYGFAFVDYASLQFWIGSVTDDASCAALGALLMQVEVICSLYGCGVVYSTLLQAEIN
ncbi:hypothetical protein QVD17_20188 [Tagetes erecta]|uniref:Uncharacterized protein n=1 Tax=Tagetes erecta TaxID=13708 RepID=A0AAD8NXY6_TARER|nr:hypothetical protein QVD17_20188 [Tagetes erecta]